MSTPGAVAPSDVTQALAMLWATSPCSALVLIPGQGKQAGADALTAALARKRDADELAGRIAVLAVAWFGGTPEAAERAHEWAQASPVLASGEAG